MKLIKSVFKNLLPAELINQIRHLRNRNTELGVLRTEVIKYYSELSDGERSEEHDQIVSFVKQYGIATFPYRFIFNYDSSKIKVYRDEDLEMHYVLHDGKRLYFKRSWDEETVRESYNFLSIEQDEQSPHRYLTDEFYVNQGDVVLDIGAAEGNFSLSIVDDASKLYIFEADSEWIEALTATFAPWKDKVQIINKYVSDKNSKTDVTIDDFISIDTDANIIKIDAEGAEKQIIAGADKTIKSNKNLKIAICTYHNQNDELELADLLQGYEFKTPTSNGYMFFLEDKLTAPFLRKVLIRAHY